MLGILSHQTKDGYLISLPSANFYCGHFFHFCVHTLTLSSSFLSNFNSLTEFLATFRISADLVPRLFAWAAAAHEAAIFYLAQFLQLKARPRGLPSLNNLFVASGMYVQEACNFAIEVADNWWRSWSRIGAILCRGHQISLTNAARSQWHVRPFSRPICLWWLARRLSSPRCSSKPAIPPTPAL